MPNSQPGQDDQSANSRTQSPAVVAFRRLAEDQRDFLPAELSTFIGREDELAQLLVRIEETRLLTIAGPGGVGKTRIALRLARALQATGEIVRLVELAPLADDNLLVPRVADALGIREQPGRPLIDVVCDKLRSSGAVLVLDNCEHLVQACAGLAETLLSRCPRLRMVMTSREALRSPGELLFQVGPLRLPPPDVTTTRDLSQSDAVRLFVERATARSSTFKLTRQNAAVIGRVCRRLDGLPLAIELAAARVNVLAPEQIETRLDDCLRLLETGVRTADPRHQTLTATFDWSYGLLTVDERRVFERLSVFAGPVELEAAEAVCGMSPVDKAHVLNHLAELVDKSLVIAEPGANGLRYRLLETVRQYAQKHLLDRSETDSAKHAQAEWYARIMGYALGEVRADRGQPSRGGGQVAWLARLEREHDNLRGVLSWTIEHGETDFALWLGAGLYRFWSYHGHLSEGRAWLSRILALAGDWHPPYADATPYMDSLFGAELLAAHQGDVVGARRYFDQIIRLATYPIARFLCAGAHIVLAGVELDEGNTGRARAMYERGLEILERQNEWMVANAVSGLADVSLREHDYVTARRLAQEALASYRGIGDQRSVSVMIYLLATIDIAERQLDSARALLQEALTISESLADPIGLMSGLVRFGSLAVADQRPEQAIRWFRAVSAHGDAGEFDFIRRRLRLHHWMQTACDLVDSTLAQSLLTAGQTLTLQEAVNEALGRTRQQLESPVRKHQLDGPLRVLTPRELEVLHVLAAGKSNREIADVLVISISTAERHVANILAKLQVNSRTAAAHFAIAAELAQARVQDDAL